MPQSPTGHVFISYSRRDDETMRKVAFFLRDQGFKVWVDNEKLIPGTPAWEESIENAIKNAFAVIVILSPDSKNSEWVRREITYSDQFQKRVFPVLIKGTEEMSLPIRLVTRQYIDLRTDEEAGLGTLLSAINFYLDEKQTLEMKRPSVIKSLISAPISTPYSTSQTKRTSRTWFLATGIIMVVCILGAGVAWTGYRLYTLSIPITGPEIAEPTIIVIAPTESIAELPTDTPTDIPTDIPAPIILNVPVPGIVSQYLVAVQVTNIDTFDDPNGAGWDVQAGKIEDGMMELYGNDDWNGAWRDREFVAGEGTLIDFSFSKGSTFTIHMNNGVNGNSYRRFGLYFENDFPIVDLYIGDFKWEDFSRITGFQPNRTYTVLIARLSEAEFVGAAWDTFTQSVVAEFRKKFDDIPDGSTWTYLIQVPGGTIQFDNFTEITFSGVK